jgi:hypothetical protein
MVEELASRRTATAEQAKDRGNGEAISIGWAAIQWDVEGDKNVTLRRR